MCPKGRRKEIASATVRIQSSSSQKHIQVQIEHGFSYSVFAKREMTNMK